MRNYAVGNFEMGLVYKKLRLNLIDFFPFKSLFLAGQSRSAHEKMAKKGTQRCERPASLILQGNFHTVMQIFFFGRVSDNKSHVL